MAGDWIKMRTDLAQDPAVIGIAALTKLDEDTVVGKLHRLWSWASHQSANGQLRVSSAWIDRQLGVSGFAKAMVENGWLEVQDGMVVFPKFDRHMSQSAKRRALNATYQANARSAKRQQPVLTNCSPEKRREENKNPPTPQGVSKRSTVDSEDFQRFWSAYPRKIAKENARKAWHKLKPGPELLAVMLQAIERQKQSEQWRRDEGQFIPHPATWLNGRRWEDQLPLLPADPDEEARRLEDERRKAEAAERKKNALPGGLATVAEILNGRRQCPNPKS